MTGHSDDLPVLVVDGVHFADFDGFAREFSRLLCNDTWRGIWMRSTTCCEEVRDAGVRLGVEMAQLRVVSESARL